MTTLIKDPKVSFIETHADIPGILNSYFPRDRPTLCPFHDDHKASLQLYENGGAHCFGCGFHANNIVDLVAKMEDLDFIQTREMLYGEIVDAIPESLVMACHKKLTREAKEYLQDRNITLGIIKEFKIGYEPATKRITIPVYDQFGTCVNVRRMGWLKSHKEKAINMKGHGEIRLFPENRIVKERRLLLVEGEWDCLVGRANGLPACTWTGGASSWNGKHEYLFRNKAVWILYDHDEAGRKGADQAIKVLKELTPHWTCLAPLSRVKGSDLSNWLRVLPERVQRLKYDIESFKFPKREKRMKVCPMCGGTGKVKDEVQEI